MSKKSKVLKAFLILAAAIAICMYFSRTIQTIQELQPNATVVSDGLSISRNSVAQAEGDVASWVSGLGLIG